MQHAVERWNASRVQYVTPVAPRRATGLVADVYGQLRAEFLLAAPFLLHSPLPELLGAVWGLCRETLIAGPGRRIDKECIATAVSTANECPFCIAAHSSALDALGADVGDPRHLLLARWASALPPGQPPAAVASSERVAFAGTLLAFHYINRMVSVHVETSTRPSPPLVRRTFRWAMTRMMKSITRKSAARGAAVFSCEADLPNDFAFLGDDPNIARAFATMVAVTEQAAERFVDTRVREVVLRTLAAWDGMPPALDAPQDDQALDSLPSREYAAARLALLTARSPHRVTAEDVAAFRKGDASDQALIALTAWASLCATRRLARDLV